MTDEEFFAQRARESEERLQKFRDALESCLGEDLSRVIGEHTAVYATGSGGRKELGVASDLDLFLVRVDGEPSPLDAVVLQSAIIHAMRQCGFKDPSRGGVFLNLHSAKEFQSLLGTPEDDASNKLTPRMLLLLESSPILGGHAYAQLIEDMVQAYWLNEESHENDYLPFVLVNDIIRYWRIILLNHESRLRADEEKLREEGRDADQIKQEMSVERKKRGYKLRFARCLICFASLIYLLAVAKSRRPPILKEQVIAMTKLTPLDRLRQAAKMVPDVAPRVNRLLAHYRRSLEVLNCPKPELDRRFAEQEFVKARGKEADEFLNEIEALLLDLRENNPLFRCILV